MATVRHPEALMTALSEGEGLPSVVFIYGPDVYTRNRLITRILEKFLPSGRDRAFGYEAMEAPEADPSVLLSTLKTHPMGLSLKIVVLQRFEQASRSVLKEDKRREPTLREEKASSLDEALIRYFAHPSRKTLLLISSASGLKKNSRLYRALPASAVWVPCVAFNPREAAGFVRERLTEAGKQASGAWVAQLVEMVGPEAQRLAGELEKVFLLAGDRSALTEGDLQVVSATEMPKDVFALLKAIEEGKRDRAMEIVREILNASEPPLRILSVLLWHYSLVLKAGDLIRGGDREALSRIHPSKFVAKKVARQARGISRAELKRAFTLLRQADRLLKGSRRPPALVMENLVYALAAGARGSAG